MLNIVRHLEATAYLAQLIVVAVLSFSPILLNYFTYTRISRWMVCALPPVMLVGLSVINKQQNPGSITILNYLDVRFLLIATMVIPLLVIQIHERRLLILTLSISGIGLAFLDPIFNISGVGYETLVGPGDKYFRSVNFFAIITYLFILISLLFEKRQSDTALRSNDTLISFLNKVNLELELQKKEIAEQNDAIREQAEELLSNQAQLLDATQVIEKQKEKLLEIQSGLRTELTERNKELTQSNQELVQSNVELQQFSYSISHNLRGPLARLLGLTSLMEKDLRDLSGGQLELVRLVGQSARELDDVIRDLGKIIDIRNDIHRIREKVFFQAEWQMVLRSLSSFITPEMSIEADFRKAPLIYTVRPILTSILYNLTSNAIKYRSPARPLQLRLSTERKENVVVLKVSDNGLGMNLEQFNRNIFGLYKRFHTHTEGKGLGLYLVKLQSELLGGSVTVESELNVGTTFHVTLSEPENLEGQVVFESDFGFVFYNAYSNCVGINWQRQPTSEEYRSLFSKSLEMVRLFHTPYWLSNLSKQGKIAPEDQQWMLNTILPEAVRHGLQKIANVYSPEQQNQDYLARIRQAVEANGITCQHFTDPVKARDWIEQFSNPTLHDGAVE